MDSESREYYASGKLKKTSVTKKGKQQGEDVKYDEKGKEIKKQFKIKNVKLTSHFATYYNIREAQRRVRRQF